MHEETFPCPLCKKERRIRWTKKEKPYLICDRCGVQMFVRYEEGIMKLMEGEKKREIDIQCPYCKSKITIII